MIGYNIRVYYSKMGFMNSLQSYVLGATVEPIRSTISHLGGTGTQAHMQIVQVSFHEEISPEQWSATKADAAFFLPDIFSDLLYPVNLAY